MSLLSVEALYKTYGEKVLFDHISFTVAEKQRIGLIGVNGTGKSTLLKVIAGMESVESGEVIHANAFRIEYLPQHPELEEDLTVLEQIYLGDAPLMVAMRDYERALAALEADPASEANQKRFGTAQSAMDHLGAWEAVTAAKTILTKLGINQFDQKVKGLSGGQKKRIALAKALIQPADLLLLDEPTNHLDHDIIEWLEHFLPQSNKALLMVTHDRYFLNRVTNRIIELDQGQLYSYDGNYEVFLEKRAEREEQAQRSEEKRQNLLRRELAWLRRGAKARTTKQKARIQRAEELQANEPLKGNDGLELSIGSNRLGKKVIELKGISQSFNQRKLIDEFDYLVVPSERLGIIGPNGSGKTTLLNIMAGKIQPDQGEIEVGPTVKIGYYTQEHEDLDMDLRVVDVIKNIAEAVKTAEGQWVTAEQMLERFLFNRTVQWTYVRKLSGGERRRLYLLSILMQEPNVLFLDEPTNDLDTETLSVLEEYLEHFPGVVITVSHDRYFLDRVVDHLLAFEAGEIHRFQGGYSDYLDDRKQRQQATAGTSRTAGQEQEASERSKPKPERRRKLSYKEQQEWDGIEERIAELEATIQQLAQSIEQAGSDSAKVQELFAEQQKTEALLEQTIERWSELSLLIEEIEAGKSS